jgi:hypothetical protein
MTVKNSGSPLAEKTAFVKGEFFVVFVKKHYIFRAYEASFAPYNLRVFCGLRGSNLTGNELRRKRIVRQHPFRPTMPKDKKSRRLVSLSSSLSSE